MVNFRKIFLLLLFPLSECAPSSFLVHQFVDDDKLDNDYPEPEGSKDHIMWEKESMPEKIYPKQFSLCFNMKYLTMDYWSESQKTILRIYQKGVDHYRIRVNHAPP